MIFFGEPVINKFIAKHADARGWLNMFVEVVR